VYSRGLGKVFAAETGFKLETNPDTVRAPDVAFVRRDRLPDPVPRGYPAMAPDLAVEVLSPDDRPRAISEKVAAWLAAGAALVWVVDPERKDARVHRADGTHTHIEPGGTLDGESILPGFTLALASVM
jgi:Uma2 family endonuclease